MPQAVKSENKQATLKNVTSQKSLKKRTTEQLERLLQVSLCSEHDNNVTTNMIIVELIARGVSKDEINKVKNGEKGDTEKELQNRKEKGVVGKGVNRASKEYKEAPEDLKKAFGDLIGSVEDIIEKGRKPAPIGQLSPDGKFRKTASGWEPVKNGKKTSSLSEDDEDDLAHIKELVDKGEIDRASRYASRLDTYVREKIPSDVLEKINPKKKEK